MTHRGGHSAGVDRGANTITATLASMARGEIC